MTLIRSLKKSKYFCIIIFAHKIPDKSKQEQSQTKIFPSCKVRSGQVRCAGDDLINLTGLDHITQETLTKCLMLP